MHQVRLGYHKIMHRIRIIYSCLALGNILKKQRVIFYFSFEHNTIEDLVRIIEENVPEDRFDPDKYLDIDDAVKLKIIGLSGHIWHTFIASYKPVLILNDIENIDSKEDLDLLNTMIRHWNVFSFIMSGSKMPVSNDILTEIPIKDPRK